MRVRVLHDDHDVLGAADLPEDDVQIFGVGYRCESERGSGGRQPAVSQIGGVLVLDGVNAFVLNVEGPPISAVVESSLPMTASHRVGVTRDWFVKPIYGVRYPRGVRTFDLHSKSHTASGRTPRPNDREVFTLLPLIDQTLVVFTISFLIDDKHFWGVANHVRIIGDLFGCNSVGHVAVTAESRQNNSCACVGTYRGRELGFLDYRT